ncbi:MAG: hypothetical protein IJT13_04125 [Bacteroidaceae bacterium]|nr:hypothetical protein [Bacteroidaceae bacterium]
MNTHFLDFWHLYAPLREYSNRYLACKRLWESMDEVSCEGILKELEYERQTESVPKVHEKNPYFYLIDWQPPQPRWLRGDEEGDLVQVKYNGRYKICTRADMELYGLEWVRDW